MEQNSLLEHILSEINERIQKIDEKIEKIDERLTGIEFEFKVFKRAGVAIGGGIAAIVGFFVSNTDKLFSFLKNNVV